MVVPCALFFIVFAILDLQKPVVPRRPAVSAIVYMNSMTDIENTTVALEAAILTSPKVHPRPLSRIRRPYEDAHAPPLDRNGLPHFKRH